MKTELIEELKSALARRDEKRSTRNEISGQIAELKSDLKEVLVDLAKLDTTVEEIQHELVTGETGLDLVDAAKRNGHPAADGDPRVAAAVDRMKDDERAKRRERDARRKDRERPDTRSTTTKPTSWVDQIVDRATAAAPEFLPMPEEGWTPDRCVNAFMALEGVGGDGRRTFLCLECGAARLSEHKKCGQCGSEFVRAILDGPHPKGAYGQRPQTENPEADPDFSIIVELRHALEKIEPRRRTEMQTNGATNFEIFDDLSTCWPPTMMYFKPRGGTSKEGHTIIGGPSPALWVGRAINGLVDPHLFGRKLVIAARKILEIGEPRSTTAIETTPARDASPPSLAADDVDEELYHALVSRKDDWLYVITAGATNAEILSFLEGIWPRHGKTFVPPDQSGGKTGYTIAFAGGCPYFWAGAFKGVGQKATYSGTELVAAVRRVLEIPTPSQAAKIAKAASREPAADEAKTESRRGLTRVEKPAENWNADNLLEAARAMGINAREMIVCGKCRTARAHPHGGPIGSDGGKCSCGSNLWHSAYGELANRSAESAKFRAATSTADTSPTFVARPVDDIADWDGTSLAKAAEELGVDVATLLECTACGAVFRRERYGLDCPKCSSTGHVWAVENPNRTKAKASRKKAKAGG